MDVQEVKKLDAYFKRVFGSPRIRVIPASSELANVFMGEEKLGELSVDEEDDEKSWNFRMEFQLGDATDIDIKVKLDSYLRRKLDNDKVRVVKRPKKLDSVELYLEEEFIGVIFIENVKGRFTYILEMPILEMDLDPV